MACPPFLSRHLESSGYADIYLDATHLKGRLGKDQQVCSRALVLAVFLAERFPQGALAHDLEHQPAEAGE